ncbi:DNA-binding response regulator [Streptomyces spongiicola]|uniref:DNA-binding response regulator n=1 Tax=Streptomyces spongiicola TaxID=1690221 RepID=A0A2S1Z2V4_9ACTN|nr:response regulator transcription factor [Streptomyces spongiicola]AWK10685.1 DNA-binding response regulator [Streptomyces spongiicola]GBQ02191.1 DNA-binding response regulator [Streptomyces spongiicola]
MPIPTVLLAEDDRALRTSVENLLLIEGYRVVTACDGPDAVAGVAGSSPDAIVLDVMMPRLDGLAVCRSLRAQGVRTPVLMLTARVEVTDRVAGLDAGADDYLVKPFEPAELLARLRALLRRVPAEAGPDRADAGTLEAGGVRLDPSSRRVWRDDEEVVLSRTEFDLLELLLRNRGVVLSHATIHERIWGYDFGPSSKNLTVFVSYLRRKLARTGRPGVIHTVRGVGYTVR